MAIDPDDVNVDLSLVISPPGTGTLRTLVMGVSDLPQILITLVENEAGDGLIIKVETGDPITQDIAGVTDLADLLDAVSETLRSSDFTAKWIGLSDGNEEEAHL